MSGKESKLVGVLPFYYVGLGDQTQFFRFGSLNFFFFFGLFLPAEPSYLLSVLGIFMKELGGGEIKPKVFHTPRGQCFQTEQGSCICEPIATVAECTRAA